MVSRRSVVLGLGSLVALTGCGAGALLASLRGILKSVEKALAALSVFPHLAPELVRAIRDYLERVTRFTDEAALVLENDALNAAQKALQILSLAIGLTVPAIPHPQIQMILATVGIAVDAFLNWFGASVQTAAQVRASGAAAKLPAMNLTATDRVMLATIETEAHCDATAVEQWAAGADA